MELEGIFSCEMFCLLVSLESNCVQDEKGVVIQLVCHQPVNSIRRLTDVLSCPTSPQVLLMLFVRDSADPIFFSKGLLNVRR